MFNVVLFEPEIPANTGNIGRTCVVTGSRLHLIRPLGFSLDDHLLRRAGLGYWENLDVTVYESWDDFLVRTGADGDGAGGTRARSEADAGGNAAVRARVQAQAGGGAQVEGGARTESGTQPEGGTRDERQTNVGTAPSGRLHLLTKKASRTYAQATYRDGDYLIFGRESSGIPEEVLAAHPASCERIPMLPDTATLANNAAWRAQETQLHGGKPASDGPGGISPLRRQDICGNFIDPEDFRISSLNLSNAAAIVLYEALRQTGFAGM